MRSRERAGGLPKRRARSCPRTEVKVLQLRLIVPREREQWVDTMDVWKKHGLGASGDLS